jgi:hypothetical protein
MAAHRPCVDVTTYNFYKGLIQGSMADLKSRTEQNRKEKKRKEQKKGPAARSSQQDVNSG